MKLVLALAGGGIKGVFQLSVLKAIFDHPFSKNIEIIDIYACSVGALVAPFIFTKQFDKAIGYVRNLKSIDDISIRWNYYNIPYLDSIIGYYNLVFNKAYYKSLNLSVLNKFKESLNENENEEICNKLHCQTFNVNTGKEELLSGPNWINYIEASASIPLLYPEKKIGKSSYIDGAISSRLAVDNIINKNNDAEILMINFKTDINDYKHINTTSLNILEYITNIISQSAELHVLNDYENFLSRIDNKKLHKISMDTKFENALDFDKYTVDTAIQEGYNKGYNWINNISLK